MKHLPSSMIALLFVASFFSLPADADRPNILIITVDDMNADSMGTFGCQLNGTSPNMDRLAKQSLGFQYAHVQCGNCMPSRNAMWSGRYPHNNHVEGFYQVRDPGYPVLTDLMKQAGYFTAIRGKVSHSTPYSPYPWDLVLDTDSDGKKWHVKDAKSYGASTSDGIRAATNAGKPFCLMINISDPHKPFYAQGKQGATVDDPHVPSRVFTADEVPVPGFLFDDPVVRKELAHYYSSVRRADDCLAGVMSALEESGESKNTCVMFLSDHGMPLPFAKTQLYHHSTHTPLLVRWPDVTEAGSIDQEHMVSGVDFLPTLLDVAGVEHPPGIDGQSFASILKGEKQTDRDFIIKEYNENAGGSRDPMRAIQTKQFLYIFNAWSNGERVMATATTGTQTCRRMAQLAKTDEAIAARYDLYQHRVPEELYDVKADPDCLHNLIDSPNHANELSTLQGSLEEWMKQTGDPMLEVFRQRHDPKVREAYVLQAEAEAEERRKKPKNPKQGSGKTKASKPKSQTLISFELPETAIVDREIELKIRHQLPEDLGKQKLHVTLKAGKAQKRVERKVVEIAGADVATIKFALPNDVPDNIMHFAAFVGDDYDNNLQHISSQSLKVATRLQN